MWTCIQGKDRDKHRLVILQKAQMLFSEHGVDKVSMHQIAKSAGIGQGTLYRRYAHKGELCLDILQESSLKVHDEMIAYLAANQSSPVQERLYQLFHIIISFLEKESAFLEAIQAPTYEGRCSILFQTPLYQAIHSAISSQLVEASQAGSHHASALYEPAFMTYAILAAMAPDLYLHLRRSCGYSPQNIVSNLQKVFIHPFFQQD